MFKPLYSNVFIPGEVIGAKIYVLLLMLLMSRFYTISIARYFRISGLSFASFDI